MAFSRGAATAGPSRVAALLVVVAAWPWVAAASEIGTGTLRVGLYDDSDDTRVQRGVAAVSARAGRLTIGANEAIDVVSSASTDVRTSPFLDAVSAATAGARMEDRRFETTLSLDWANGQGHAVGLSAIHAGERDYRSLLANLRGSWEPGERNTTLLGGLTVGADRIESTMDPDFAGSLTSVGASFGVAQVLGATSVVRLRYDGSFKDGYQASPYRSVRFGDWTTAPRAGGAGVAFQHTIGGARGLPEDLPATRLAHAGTAEWVHELAAHVGLLAAYRIAFDDWGVLGQGPSAEIRFHHWESLPLRASYAYYHQLAADFWRGRYVLPPESYTHYTADKELGDVRGHIGTVGAGYVFARGSNRRVGGSLDVAFHALHYRYPEFPLLSQRTALLGEAGLTLEF